MPPKSSARIHLGKIVKASKKSKINFVQYELDLSKNCGDSLELPQSFIEQHTVDFVKGVNHVVKVDPTLYPLVIRDKFDSFTVKSRANSPKEDQDFFKYIIKSIISQQVSGAAAKSIEAKFLTLFQGEFPQPEQLSLVSNDQLRAAGVSMRKCQYFKSACQKFIDKELTATFFQASSNDEIIERLVEIKGVGPWTARMFLIFALGRLDVFTSEDLGVARGFSRYLENRSHLLDSVTVDQELLSRRAKFHDNKQRDWAVYHDSVLDSLAMAFQPYRTVLMLVLWRASATDIEALS